MNLPSRYVAIAIGDVYVQAFIDSGADCSMIREDVFSKLPSNFRANIKKTTKRLVSYGGRPFPSSSLNILNSTGREKSKYLVKSGHGNEVYINTRKPSNFLEEILSGK